MSGLIGVEKKDILNKTNMYEQIFPFLVGTNWKITSPQDANYNCIAWAANDINRFWWPDVDCHAYWPRGVPREETAESFIKAYQTVGFELCDNIDFENGYEKIAIYIGNDGKPKHAARQLSNSKWTSKLGQSHDIEHDLYSLNNSPSANPFYGEVKIFMKREIK